MNFKIIGAMLAIAISLIVCGCRKDIAPIPQKKFARNTDSTRPVESDTTDVDSTNAGDSTAKTTDSVPKAADPTGDNQIETAPLSHTAVFQSINGNVGGFWQSVPAGYAKTTKQYPLIVFLHGVGELGTNLARINCCGLPRHIQNRTFPPDFQVKGKHYSFIVMSPQFKRRASPADVQSVIDFAKKRFRVDPARVYVAGMSLGGGSAWDYSAVYGQNAAAVVPVCGGTQPTPSLARNVASKYLPIWAIHSTGDRLVPALWGKEWVDWIRKDNPAMAGNVKLTIWTSIDHNGTWGRAFDPNTRTDGLNIYQWMLQYARS